MPDLQHEGFCSFGLLFGKSDLPKQLPWQRIEARYRVGGA
jgi:hypothetical protein